LGILVSIPIHARDMPNNSPSAHGRCFREVVGPENPIQPFKINGWSVLPPEKASRNPNKYPAFVPPRGKPQNAKKVADRTDKSKFNPGAFAGRVRPRARG